MIGLDPHFLPISEVIIGSKNVHLLNSNELEYRPSHRPRVLAFAGGGNLIALLYIWDLISNIHDAPSLSVGVLDHDLGAPLEKPIPRVSPWDLLVGLDVLAQGLRKWKLFTPFFSVVVTLLDII